MHAGLFCVLSSIDFFFKISFLAKKSFRNTTRVSKKLDSDQALCVFGPDLATICLQMLSADDKTCHEQAKC